MKPYLKAIAACVALMLVLAAICAMCGCGRDCEESADTTMPTTHRFAWAQNADGDNPFNYSAYTITDNATGVQYLVVDRPYGTSITPLLDTDGKPYVSADNG